MKVIGRMDRQSARMGRLYPYMLGFAAFVTRGAPEAPVQRLVFINDSRALLYGAGKFSLQEATGTPDLVACAWHPLSPDPVAASTMLVKNGDEVAPAADIAKAICDPKFIETAGPEREEHTYNLGFQYTYSTYNYDRRHDEELTSAIPDQIAMRYACDMKDDEELLEFVRGDAALSPDATLNNMSWCGSTSWPEEYVEEIFGNRPYSNETLGKYLSLHTPEARSKEQELAEASKSVQAAQTAPKLSI